MKYKFEKNKIKHEKLAVDTTCHAVTQKAAIGVID